MVPSSFYGTILVCRLGGIGPSEVGLPNTRIDGPAAFITSYFVALCLYKLWHRVSILSLWCILRHSYQFIFTASHDIHLTSLKTSLSVLLYVYNILYVSVILANQCVELSIGESKFLMSHLQEFHLVI